MRYQDKHGNEITEGMYLRFEDGSVEQVYAWQTGDENDLGINASNEAYLQAHGLGEFPQELYPLSEFGMTIKERVPIQMSATKYDLFYLRTKQQRMGHLLRY